MQTIRVQGFQSLEDVTLKLGNFTTVEGDSRAGKSALVRCLRVWAFNAKSVGAFVRHGEKSFTVTVNIDGHEVRCRRGESVTEYVLDGEMFEKIGFSVPEAVAEATGFRAIRYDRDLVLPLQVQGQFDAPFLLGEQWSGPAITKVLGSVSRINVIYAAQRIARKRQRRTQQSIGDKQELVAKLEEQLEQYAAVDRQIELVELAEETWAGAVDDGLRHDELVKVETDRDEAQERLDALEEPTSQPKAARSRVKDIRSGLTDWSELLSARDDLANARNVLAGIMEPMSNPTAARGHVDALRAELQVLGELRQVKRDHVDAAKAVETAMAGLGTAKGAMAEANKAKADFFDELGTCPFCGQVTRGQVTA